MDEGKRVCGCRRTPSCGGGGAGERCDGGVGDGNEARNEANEGSADPEPQSCATGRDGSREARRQDRGGEVGGRFRSGGGGGVEEVEGEKERCETCGSRLSACRMREGERKGRTHQIRPRESLSSRTVQDAPIRESVRKPNLPPPSTPRSPPRALQPV